MGDIMSKGGLVMYPLLLCSLVSLTVIFERIIFWCRRARSGDSELVQGMFDVAEGREPRATPEGHGATRDYLAVVLAAGLEHRDLGPREAMEAAAQQQMASMKRGLGILHTIIAMAPLLGILGTVVGIIQSFDVLGRAGISDPRAVTGGIAQALVTTAAGLSIAIATLIPYEYFAARVRRAAEKLSLVTTQFELALRKGSVNENAD